VHVYVHVYVYLCEEFTWTELAAISHSRCVSCERIWFGFNSNR